MGGSSIGIRKYGKEKPDAVRYAMLKRGLYLHDDPSKGYVATPCALNHPSGGCAEKLSTTMLKEAQEELQIFLMGRRNSSEKSGYADIFDALVNTSIYPVILLHNGTTGLSESEHLKIIDAFFDHIVHKNKHGLEINFPLDQQGELNTFVLPYNLSAPRVVRAKLDETKKDRCKTVITRINGEIFDEAFGIPFFDVRHNSFELTQALILDIPRNYKVIHLLGCEPDFDRQAHFYTQTELLNMDIAAKYPFDEGIKAGGLSRSSYALVHNHISSLSFDQDTTTSKLLYKLALEQENERYHHDFTTNSSENNL